MSATNEGLFARAQAVIPGGVNSPVRSFRSVGGTPYFVARADGPFVHDVEGKRYIDYVQSYGPGILGHAHPSFTMHTYQHLLPGMGATAANQLPNLIDDSRQVYPTTRTPPIQRSRPPPVENPVAGRLDPRTAKARKPLSFRAFVVVAGAGFEPATFGL